MSEQGGDSLGHGEVTVALLADLHLDSPFVWTGPVAGARWRQALRDTLRRSVEVAREEEVDALFLAGDIYEHTGVAPDTAAFLADELATLEPIPVLVAPGNHDYLCPSSVWVQGRWSPNVHVFEQGRWGTFELAEGLTVWGIAHGVPAGTPAMLNRLQIERGGVNVGLFHGALRSGVPFGATAPDPHLPFDLVDVARAGLDHAFCGHYHTPRHEQVLTYPGNPNPLGFGETGNRGLVLASIDGTGGVRCRTVAVAQSEIHDLVIDLTGASSSDAVRDRCLNQLSGLRGAARVTLTGELPVDVDLNLLRLQDLPTQLDALMVRADQIRPAYDFDALREEPTVRGQFVRDVLDDEGLDSSMKMAVLTTGLRALDGRDDLEVAW